MFKVGDKVEVKGYEEGWNGKGTVEECYGIHVIVKFNRKYPRNRGFFPPQYVHKIGNPSPVRTVTRREIVPGVYAKLTIDTAGHDHVRVATSVNMSAEELREAAHLLNQLAEALEDKP